MAARRWRTKNRTAAAAATTSSTIATVFSLGTGRKLIATISPPTNTAESTPPRLSTGSVPSLTWLGTKKIAIGNAIATSGSVTRNTEPQLKCSSRAPEMSGPSSAIPPPRADQSAIDFVRPGPDHNAVINASVVG